MSLVESLRYLLPMLVLASTAILVLLLDMMPLGEVESDALRIRKARRAYVFWWLAVCGTLISIVTVLLLGFQTSQMGGDDTTTHRVLAVMVFDPLASYTWLLLNGALLLLLGLGRSYVDHRIAEPGLFYATLLLFGAAALLLATATNTIMLLLTVDFLSLLGYALTGFLHDDKRSTEGAIKYLIYGSAISAVMALGLAWLYGITGSTDYDQISRALAQGLWPWPTNRHIDPVILTPVFVFILAGFAFKLGVAPFHQWVPDAFEGAPTPATAALAILPKVAGFAALMRLTVAMLPAGSDLASIWRNPLILTLSFAAMLIGNLAGLWQDNIKRLMAYSGIAQAGYALGGAVLGTQEGFSALLIYLTAYTVTELAVFAAITVVSDKFGLDEIDDYRGIYRRAPLLAAALLIGLLSLFGMPGTAGFMAKLWLFSAALSAHQLWWLLLAAINSVISMAYYWRVIRVVMMHTDEGLGSLTIPWASWVTLLLACLAVLSMGIFPSGLIRWAYAAVAALF